MKRFARVAAILAIIAPLALAHGQVVTQQAASVAIPDSPAGWGTPASPETRRPKAVSTIDSPPTQPECLGLTRPRTPGVRAAWQRSSGEPTVVVAR